MKLSFTKMHGAGNDFVVVDGVKKAVQLSADQIRAIADRRTGVGCDQVLLVEPPKRPDADFEYRIFNSDGSAAGQCGNGARCLGRFIRDQRLSNKASLALEVGSDIRRLEFTDDDQVLAELGAPCFDHERIPCTRPISGVEQVLQVSTVSLSVGILSMGNPHAVVLVDNVDATPVDRIGPMIQALDIFPEGVNVGFMEIENPSSIKLRVYERGAGETQACGSGACAAVIHGIRLGHLSSKVTVSALGGKLEVSWEGDNSPVWLSGPAKTVFEGKLTL